MEAVSIQTAKSAARRRFRDVRRNFGAGKEAQPLLQAHLRKFLQDLADSETQVALFRALPEEASAELHPYTRYFYPRLQGDTLEFRRPRREDAFELNSFRIPEPIEHSSDPLDPAKPLIVCCPAVAVDWQGGRIGMGKGYYDRFFADHPQALRAGVVFQVQVSKVPLPAESWDQALDWIVTEKMILRTSDRSP